MNCLVGDLHFYKVCNYEVQAWFYYRLMEMYIKVNNRQYSQGNIPVMMEHRRTLSKRLRDYNEWRITGGGYYNE